MDDAKERQEQPAEQRPRRQTRTERPEISAELVEASLPDSDVSEIEEEEEIHVRKSAPGLKPQPSLSKICGGKREEVGVTIDDVYIVGDEIGR